VKTIAIKPKKPKPQQAEGARSIIYPDCGNPYYISADGRPVFLSPPGTPKITSEDVRRELEDFP
jgi:hypothetical protein